MNFSPAALTVNEGDTVTWINRDIVDQNVTEEVNKEWASGNLPPGRSWEYGSNEKCCLFRYTASCDEGELECKVRQYAGV